MDEKEFNPEKELETVAEAIIDSFIDEDIEPVSKEDIAIAIEVGASTLVGIDSDDEGGDKADSEGTKKGKKKVNGTFFLGFVSILFAFLCIICCCIPFAFPIALPIQLLFLTLAIIFLILDKKYNGKSSFSVSAIVGIIFSICIVIFTLLWVCVMLIFGLIVKPAIEENVLPPIINMVSSIL